MFTGLVEAVGELVERKPAAGGFRLRIGSSLASQLSQGDSLAVNGVCLTVVLTGPEEIHADVGPETVRATTLGWLAPGSRVNLERPLRADARIGGHFVQGHVDAMGQVEALQKDADFHWLAIAFPSQLAPFIVLKGSIAVDGISLTVARLGSDRLDVQLVPYTMEHTNLSRVQLRDRVNLECDIVGKYVVRAAELAGLTVHGAQPGETTH
jgi:riboflavin synthase